MARNPIIVVEVPQAHFISVSWNPKKPLEHSIRALSVTPEYGVGVILVEKKQPRKSRRFVVGCVDVMYNGLDGVAEATRLLLKEFKGNTAELTARIIVPEEYLRISLVAPCAHKVSEILRFGGIAQNNLSFSHELCSGIDMATGGLLSADTLASPHCLSLQYAAGAAREITNFIKAAQNRRGIGTERIRLLPREVEERYQAKEGWDRFQLFTSQPSTLRAKGRGAGNRRQVGSKVNHNRDVT